MKSGLIQITKCFNIKEPLQNKEFETLFHNLYEIVDGVCQKYNAKNIEYFKNNLKPKNDLESTLKDRQKTLVDILDHHFPDLYRSQEKFSIPISKLEVVIKVMERNSNKSFEFELYLTSDWLTMIGALPGGYVLALGDCSSDLQTSQELNTFIFPYDNGTISKFKSFKAK